MNNRPAILIAASEVFPFAKTGGLADAVHSLASALSETYAVTVVMPMYRFIPKQTHGIVSLNAPVICAVGEAMHAFALFGMTRNNIRYRFVYASQLCECDYAYGPPGGAYPENAYRFGIFSRAIAALAKKSHFDIVHLNDWHTALAALFIAEHGLKRTKTVYTIHNLGYQGVFDASERHALGIDAQYYTSDCIEFYGQISFMKAGIAFADAVTTVSPTYAKEILHPEYGCGLDGFLTKHRHKLSGILNGIDAEQFSPNTDTALFQPFSHPKGKATNKQQLFAHLGFDNEDTPLFVWIGRFVWQKGIELLIKTLPLMAQHPCRIAIMGSGERGYVNRLSSLAAAYDNVHLSVTFDETMAHRLYGAGDFLLMPSQYEPCGLSQLIAMRYGMLPVVHGVGGLADTVSDISDGCRRHSGWGFVFDTMDADAFVQAFESALALYGDHAHYAELAAYNMAVDFSAASTARHYGTLYRSISNGRVK